MPGSDTLVTACVGALEVVEVSWDDTSVTISACEIQLSVDPAAEPEGAVSGDMLDSVINEQKYFNFMLLK